METKFTKGPWFIDESFGTMLLISGRESQPVCEVDCLYSRMKHSIEPSEEEIANARLLAAAPEMYEALEALLNECAELNIFVQSGIGAAAALVKARGES